MNLEKPKWPDGKKCAAMLTINLNAELFWLQIDPSCKDMPKTLSLGQYGMTRGVDRILSILKERGIKGTFFTPGWVAEQYPDKLKKIKEKLITLIDIQPKHLMIQLRPTILYRKTRQRILKTKSAVQAVSKQKKPYLPLNQNNLS